MWTGGNDSTAGGFLNTTTNPLETTENKEAPRRIQNVMPLVIQQIKNCEGEDFKLFGMTAQIIKLVGIVRNFEVQTTKANYTIEDHTGEIKAILWLESDNDSTTNLPSVKEGSYVEIYGSLRTQDKERILMVLRMFPVSDCNIITTHLLKVIYNRLSAEADTKRMFSDIKANNPGRALVTSMSFVDTDQEHMTPSGLTLLQEKVLNLLSKNLTSQGMSRDTLLTHFDPHKHHEVNGALDFLSNEGHLYSTTDNDHFKVTTVS